MRANVPADRRLAVLGSPVSHSRSPALHAAAYGVLGLTWHYDAVELPADRLAGFVDGLGPEWRGLSLTMPHKEVVIPLLDEQEPLVTLTGAANTLLLDDGRRIGFNTDVHGIVAALREPGPRAMRHLAIVGSGATAASAVVAASALGAERVTVLARNAERAARLADLAGEVGLRLETRPLEAVAELDGDVDALVSTLPGTAADPLVVPERVRSRAVLLDVAYAAGRTRLSEHWAEAGGTVVPGLAMLLHQAVEQVRVFTTGGRDAPLERETEVVAAMREAIGLAR